MAGGRRIEQALAAVLAAGALLDEAGIDQLLQDARQALLGDLQDVEQVGDRQAGIAVDEMQHAVMRAAEVGLRQDRVGIGDEVAIGEEQELDQVHHRVLSAAAGTSRGERMIYVSHIDISCRFATLRRLGADEKAAPSRPICARIVRPAQSCRIAREVSSRRRRGKRRGLEDNDDGGVPFDQMTGKIWFNGAFVDWADAKVHVLTHGLHYASCVFEGERAYGGEIFKLREHTERLFNSARMLDFAIPYSVDEIDAVCRELLVLNNLSDAYVRPVAWRGSEMMGVSAQTNRIHVAIAVWDWPSYFSPEERLKGIRLDISEWRRPDPRTMPASRRPPAST